MKNPLPCLLERLLKDLENAMQEVVLCRVHLGVGLAVLQLTVTLVATRT